MTEKRVDIVINETGARVVTRRIENIGKAANDTQGDIDRMNASLKILGRGSSAGVNVLKKDLGGLTTNAQKSKSVMEALGGSAQRVGAKGKEIRKVTNEVDRLGKKTKKTNELVGFLRRGLALVAGAQIIRGTVRIADGYTNVQNRLKLVTEGTEELANVTERLFEIANNTRVSFTGTAEVYARTALAVKDLGISQQETLNFTESLNQAVILSGASAQEANAGMIQLSQGLASGALRGDELRSVLEQLPAVSDVIAKSLGVTRGELRKMGTEGKITAKVILKAFREAREELQTNFDKTVGTITQSFTVLTNKVTKTIGDLDKATGATEVISKAVLFLADNIEVLVNAFVILAPVVTLYIIALKTNLIANFANAIITLTIAMATQGGVITLLTAKMVALNAVLALNPILFIVTAVLALVAAYSLLGDETEELKKEMEDLNAEMEKFIKNNIEAFASKPVSLQLSEDIEKGLKPLKEQAELLKLNNRELRIEVMLRKAIKDLSLKDSTFVKDAIRDQIKLNLALERQGKIIEGLDSRVKDFRETLSDVTDLQVAGVIGPEEAEQVLGETELGKGLTEAKQFTRGDDDQSEIDKLTEDLNRREQIFREAEEVRLISIKERDAQILLLQNKFEEDSLAIVEESEKKKTELKEAEAGAQLTAASQLASSLSALANQFAEGQEGENKAAFALAKTFAVASALLNIAKGVTDAFATGATTAQKFAGAAAVAAGGAQLVSTVKSINLADGGFVTGPGGPRDDLVSANLSNGEFVVNAQSTSLNRSLLESINSGRSTTGTSAPSFTGGANFSGRGPQKSVVVNVFPIPGVAADIETTEDNDETRISIMLKKVDEKLAADFSQNRGKLTEQIKQGQIRQF